MVRVLATDGMAKSAVDELKAKGFVNIFQRTYITDYTGNLTIEEIVGDYNEFVGKQQEQTE